jgi:hypothetical protein
MTPLTASEIKMNKQSLRRPSEGRYPNESRERVDMDTDMHLSEETAEWIRLL